MTSTPGVVDQPVATTYLPHAYDLASHQFTGKERDTESGNDYFGARYYASTMGRFLSPDWSAKVEPVPYAKLDNPQSLNLYAYVGNNPLTRFDATGHYQCNGNKDQCAEIKAALNVISGAVSKLGADSKEGKALQKVLDFYGLDTAKNGVTASFASLDKGVVGTEVRDFKAGTTGITFDLKQIDSQQNVAAGIFAMSEMAGVVGHEVPHATMIAGEEFPSRRRRRSVEGSFMAGITSQRSSELMASVPQLGFGIRHGLRLTQMEIASVLFRMAHSRLRTIGAPSQEMEYAGDEMPLLSDSRVLALRLCRWSNRNAESPGYSLSVGMRRSQGSCEISI